MTKQPHPDSATRSMRRRPQNAAMSFFALAAKALDSAPADLASLRGKVVLVVNVASACGFTPQYAGLQKLHDELQPRGFAVVGFPSNDFGAQEPGDAAQIREFCSAKYHVTFPLFAKVVTKAGAEQSPVYAWLQQATGKLPNWNFCKYLIAKDGTALGFFAAKVAPDAPELRAAITAALG
jgi:glutathione peroxidase